MAYLYLHLLSLLSVCKCHTRKYRNIVSHSSVPYFIYLWSLDRLIVNITSVTGCLNKDLQKPLSVLESETQTELLGHNYHSKMYRGTHCTRDSRMSRERSSNLKTIVTSDAYPGGRAVYGVGLLPFACWDCEFESSRVHGCLSVTSTVCVVRKKYLRRADHSFEGVLPSVVV